MYAIQARNVQQALPNALHSLAVNGIKRDSRNGPVIYFPAPAIIEYAQPCERVMFWPERDCNPFFHLMECLWMLAGRNDVAFPAHYVKNMKSFSDDGETFNAAYGYRWRKHFGRDQLFLIALALHDNPDCRRQVLGVWDVRQDLGLKSKDLPCNTQAYFARDPEGKLNMTVLNRSNDLVWGALGANAVHFSFLQEYMAALIGCPVGKYWQVSNNLHGYLTTTEPLLPLGQLSVSQWVEHDPYAQSQVEPWPILAPGENMDDWHSDLGAFMSMGTVMGLKTKFFRRVVVPIFLAHEKYKVGEGEAKFGKALDEVKACEASDWRRACAEWIVRRQVKFEKAQDVGVAHE
jgi:hypothetical protein